MMGCPVMVSGVLPVRICCVLLGLLLGSSVGLYAEHPNVVYILTDDQGYGDVSALNPEGKIPTPHIDRLAKEGITFTDAHSASSVCTPTRYQLLTGRYSWRTKLKQGVLNGYSKPLIPEDRLTWASLLQAHGYQTAMIGKWHLGMDLPILQMQTKGTLDENGEKRKRNLPEIDWSQPIGRTPTSNGFDTFWGHGSSLDFPPYVYIENDRYTSQEVAMRSNRDFGFSSFFRAGPTADNFNPWTTLDEFRDRSVAYILNWDGKKPFALYVPLTSPHTPIIPTSDWKGKSGLGDYGDFVMQTDGVVGAILDALEERRIAENTLVVFTADNGASPRSKPEKLAEKGHHPNGIYRGTKADIYEGGHRVPHLVRWPARIKAGTHTDRLTVLGDIVATLADIVGAELPENAAEDSVSFYPALLGQKDPEKEHPAIIHHSVSGQFAIRTREWKLAFCAGSGGWSLPKDQEAKAQGLPPMQLYHMREDPGETTNRYADQPDVVEELTRIATAIVVNGRSTPGAPQPNDTPNHWKQLHWMSR